jgi:hypothetical protein
MNIAGFIKQARAQESASASKPSRPAITPLDEVRSIADLYPVPVVYERAAFMDHIRRYERETLREHYLRQPVVGADVWANYAVNLWEYEHGVDTLTSHPWNIAIPMTEVCNALCAFCSSPLVPNPKTLAVHEVQHFADALRYAICVGLQGLGEPLAHPQFEEVAEQIRRYLSPVAQVEIITNGWLLSGHRWALLKSLRIMDIQVSVNAATDGTHQIAMGSKPGTFDKVVKNIQDVLSDSEWHGNLKASMVITRHSLAEVPQFLDFFFERGVRLFQFNPLLPLTAADWGFGRTDQYLDLWCGHLPDAADLVDRAAASIKRYQDRGFLITATPEQWLLPVASAGRSALSTGQQRNAVFQIGPPRVRAPERERLCVWIDRQRVDLEPHDQYTEISGLSGEGVAFQGTAQSCRWAYLLRTPRIPLRPGEYTLEVDVDVEAGSLYAGILDVEANDFVVQRELGPGRTAIPFELADGRIVDIIIRQGADDRGVRANFRGGRLSEGTVGTAADEPAAAPPVVAATSPEDAPSQTDTPVPVIVGDAVDHPGPSKASRVYCPMVYTTLSVFHHSLDVSICCYMENAPGTRGSNLKSLPVLQAYNSEGFKLVRSTLATDHHLQVCDTCPYDGSRT